MTEFSLRIIPLGGFVQFYENSEFQGLKLFENVSLVKKSLIVLAGPLINFIFAFILLLFLNQGEQFKIIPQITAINSQSIAAKLGFRINDIIVSINDNKFTIEFNIFSIFGISLISSYSLIALSLCVQIFCF